MRNRHDSSNPVVCAYHLYCAILCCIVLFDLIGSYIGSFATINRLYSIVQRTRVHHKLNSMHTAYTNILDLVLPTLNTASYRLSMTLHDSPYECRWMPFEDVIAESTHPLISKICSTLYCGPDGAPLPLGHAGPHAGPVRHMREDAVQWPGREPYLTYFAA